MFHFYDKTVLEVLKLDNKLSVRVFMRQIKGICMLVKKLRWERESEMRGVSVEQEERKSENYKRGEWKELGCVFWKTEARRLGEETDKNES